jgi:transposase
MLWGMKAYSMDLRERVIAACDAGRRTKEVAQTFKVSPAWVRRLKQHRRERGDIVPRNGGGSRGRKIDRQRLAELVQEKPDATLVELRDRLVAQGGKKVTPWAICKALQELKLTFKKSLSMPASRTGRMSQRVEPCGK